MDRTAIEFLRSPGSTPGSPLDIASSDAAMHLVVIGGLDPAAEDTWSGTPNAMIAALREAGHRVSTIGPLQGSRSAGRA